MVGKRKLTFVVKLQTAQTDSLRDKAGAVLVLALALQREFWWKELRGLDGLDGSDDDGSSEGCDGGGQMGRVWCGGENEVRELWFAGTHIGSQDAGSTSRLVEGQGGCRVGFAPALWREGG